jgi:DNA-binding NtrC family response regulator
LLDDDPSDTQFIRNALEDRFWCVITQVDSEAALETALEQNGIDLVVAEYHLKSFDGLSLLKRAKRMPPEVPFIFVSETLDGDAVLEAFRHGAADYILKTKWSCLMPAVRRAKKEPETRKWKTTCVGERIIFRRLRN